MIQRVPDWRNRVVDRASQILAEVSARYGLRQLVLIPPIRGGWNAILHVTDGCSDYCVKVLNEETSGVRRRLESLEAVAAFVARLPGAGFRQAPVPYPDEQGQYVCRCAGYPVILTGWMPEFEAAGLTEEAPQKTATARAAAELLADLHAAINAAGADLTDREFGDLPWLYGPSRWARELPLIFQQARGKVMARGGGPTHCALLEAAHSLCTTLVQEELWFFSSPSREVLVHGDFRPENVALGTGGLRAIADFDMCHRSFREAEVVYGALCFAGTRWFMGRRDWQVVRAFLAGYQGHEPQPSLDPRLLFVAFRWIPLRYLSLSFKPEQLEPRLGIYQEVVLRAKAVRSWCWR